MGGLPIRRDGTNRRGRKPKTDLDRRYAEIVRATIKQMRADAPTLNDDEMQKLTVQAFREIAKSLANAEHIQEKSARERLSKAWRNYSLELSRATPADAEDK